MNKKVIILGASGACLDILSIIEDINSNNKEKIEFIGFFEDNKKKIKKNHLKFYLGKFNSNYNKYKDIYFITAFGNETNFLNRSKIINNLKIPKNKFTNIIHPTSIINKNSKIGYGNVIHAYVTISRDVRINNQIVILPKTRISHDTSIGSFSIINTNCIISGDVKIGKSCYIGAGSNIRDHVKIANRSLVGMGAVVVKNISTKGTYFGNPAKKYQS